MNADAKKLASLGDYEFECKNYASAYDYYKKGVEEDPENPYLWYRRSWAAAKLDNVNEFLAGFNKAINLAEGDLLSEIKAQFIMEKILIYRDTIELNYKSACDSSYDHLREVRKINACQQIEKNIQNILSLRDELVIDNKYRMIDDSHASFVMKMLYETLITIEKYKGKFGELEWTWRRLVGKIVVPAIDNTAAWLNFKLQKNEFQSLASVMVPKIRTNS